jgi:hypothetical protein
MRVYRSDVVSLRSAEAKPPRSVHRLDEPTGLSLSMVASPQCRFRFARQNHCSAAATGAANFRIRRHPAKTLGASRIGTRDNMFFVFHQVSAGSIDSGDRSVLYRSRPRDARSSD